MDRRSLSPPTTLVGEAAYAPAAYCGYEQRRVVTNYDRDLSDQGVKDLLGCSAANLTVDHRGEPLLFSFLLFTLRGYFFKLIIKII